MSFHNIELPQKFFGFGSVFGPQHDTRIAESKVGVETRGGNWRHTRTSYDVNNTVLSETTLRELQEFVIARKGSANSFKITDPMDFSTAAIPVNAHANNDVRIGTGDGVASTFFLMKFYQGGGTNQQYELTRALTKPNDVLVSVDGVAKTDPTDYTVNATDGTITFTGGHGPPARGAGVFMGCSFFVEVRFKLELDDWLKNRFSDFESGDASTPMIQVKDAALTPGYDRPVFDSGFSHSATAGVVQLEFQQGFFHFITPSTAMDARLPHVLSNEYTNSVSPGGAYFVVFNLGTANITFKELVSTWDPIKDNSVLLPKTARKFWLNGVRSWRGW